WAFFWRLFWKFFWRIVIQSRSAFSSAACARDDFFDSLLKFVALGEVSGRIVLVDLARIVRLDVVLEVLRSELRCHHLLPNQHVMFGSPYFECRRNCTTSPVLAVVGVEQYLPHPAIMLRPSSNPPPRP